MFDPKVRRVARLASAAVMMTVLAVPASTQQQQQVLPPIARYTVDAGTMSGMAAMSGGGMGAAMAMMRGGAGSAAHELVLRIGSTREPTGAPTAEHFMPAGAQLGKSVKLVTPVRQPSPDAVPEGQLPKGRLLIYWGCGATAAKGQPIVIDFSKVARGQIPPGLYQQPISLPGDWDLTPGNSRTYADWPNAQDGKAVRPNSSLIGAHKITSSYAPEISFALDRDFMPALNARSAEQADGSIMLNWNALPAATGYYAWVFSAKDGGRGGQPTDMVWWASSATQAFGGPLWQWLSPAAVQRLIAARTVMPPSQTSCQVPAEVRKSGGEMTMGNLYAYGPEQHFAYPPRPTDPKVAWKPDWTARVRFRSNTMFMVGMEGMSGMSGMSRGADDTESGQDQGQQQGGEAKPKCKGLGGIAKRAAGLCV